MNVFFERLSEFRLLVSAFVAAVAGRLLEWKLPFPANDPLMALLRSVQPQTVAGLEFVYVFNLYSTPFLLCLWILSIGYVYVYRVRSKKLQGLPPYEAPEMRRRLFLILGEVHHATALGRSPKPGWLSIAERGAYGGIAAFGAIGTGKTRCVMRPIATQLFGFRPDDPVMRIGGLVLEVKGNFCFQVREILESYGRAADYVEVSLDSEYVYNPLRNNMTPFALAYGLASLMNNLYGRGKEPFWQLAYTNLVKFTILLHRVLYDYVTFFDIYHCTINEELMRQRMKEAEALLVPRSILSIAPESFIENSKLDQFEFSKDDATGRLHAFKTAKLEEFLRIKNIPFTEASAPVPPAWDALSAEQFGSVKRWYEHDWQRLDKKLQASIVEGISVLLSAFDDPVLRRIFCPPKAAFDPKANVNFALGRPLPMFAELIESGLVCALNFPVSADPGLARIVGTMMKLSFQRDVLNRIPLMWKNKTRHFRPVAFFADECHAFVTCGGEGDPTGDDKFFSLSREAKCIGVIATQSISSLQSALGDNDAACRTFLQCFRTKVFLGTTDPTTAKIASELCGEHEVLRPSYTISEQGHETQVSTLTGRAGSASAGIGLSTTYAVQKMPRFEPTAFFQLGNAQSIVSAYDGSDPLPSTYCYLKPYDRDPNESYFEQEGRGVL